MITKDQVDDAFADQALYQAFHDDGHESILQDSAWQEKVKTFWDLVRAYVAQEQDGADDTDRN